MTSCEKEKALPPNDMHMVESNGVPPKPGADDSGDENTERGNWSNHVEFLMSCVSYAVGLGNVWRFPYLCYSNGGGAFLIPYIIMLLFAGLPLFFLELSFGQYTSSGPISVWRAVPLFRGVGYGMVVCSFLVAIYYNVIITYTIFYMFKSMTTSLPWVGCHHEWNTPYCSELFEECMMTEDEGGMYPNGGLMLGNNTCVSRENMTMDELSGYNISINSNNTYIVNYADPLEQLRVRPSEEYYRNGVLHDSGSINNSGYIIWQLALCLLLAWTIEFVCLARGVKSSGKVVYFTAIFPYIVLFILLIRGVTLPGSIEGIKFFITPRWSLLKNPKVWKDAAVQIFYSLSVSWGGLITLSSYNRFKNNCLRDALIVPLLNCATSIFAGFVIFSILGFMAHELKKPVGEVVAEQFGLAFIAYPEAVAKLPISPLWAFLFFFMLLTLGLGSQLCIVETVVTSIVDHFPSLRKRKIYVLAGVCTVSFLLGLNCVTQAGSYWVVLMDKYAADFALLIYGLCECVGLGWCYGIRRFINDIRTMIGSKWVDQLPFKWFPLNWCALTPAILSFVLLFNWISWENPTAGEYEFPPWAHGFGWMMIMTSLIWIPLVAVYEVIKADGTLMERLKQACQSTEDWGPAITSHRRDAYDVHKQFGTEMGGSIDPKCEKPSLDYAVKYVAAKQEEAEMA